MEKKSGKLLALKIYEIYKIKYPYKQSLIKREICTLRALKHPNIIKLIYAFTSPTVTYLCMSYPSGITLSHYIQANNGPVEPKIVYRVIR